MREPNSARSPRISPRKSVLRGWFAAAAGVCLIWPPATAASADGGSVSTAPGGDPVQQQLETMKNEIDRLRHDNDAMRSQIDDLHARTEDNWLTEARAEQIKGLVEDVLADADTRASLLSTGMTAGWSEHFFLASPDGKFKLVLDGELQFRWILNHHDVSTPAFLGNPPPDLRRTRSGFEESRVRLTFSGHVFTPDLQYLVRYDFSQSRELGGGGLDTLLDSWVRYNLDNHWSVRAGQFKIPFNREELVSNTQQLAVERSLVNEALNLGRSQGIELVYHDDVNSFAIMVNDGASAGFLGSPQANGSWSRRGNEYAVAHRYERLLAGSWEQFKDFTSPIGDEYGMLFGFATATQRGEANGVSSNGSSNEQGAFSATADLSIEFGGSNFFISGIYQYVDPAPNNATNIFGIVAQYGVYLAPKWEVFFRGEFLNADTAIKIPNVQVVTFGVNYYIQGQDVKFSADCGVSFNELDPRFASDLAGYRSDFFGPQGLQTQTDLQIVVRTQFQLLF